MPILSVYDFNREKVGEYAADDNIFAVNPEKGLLHEVVVWQQAKKRAGTASAKTRSEVSGGGKKPWKQKGTGRARSGSNTSPLWRRGGTVFGPKPRDYSYVLPKKVKSLGLKMALSSKAMSENLFIVREFGLQGVKTRDMADFLRRFEVENAVIVADAEDRVLSLSTRNIRLVKVLPPLGLNVYDILKHKHLIVKESLMGAIEERFKK
jgi:large subunit ribosomal protein L4